MLFIGVGLHPLLGRFCTLVYATMFVGLNFTTSSGVFGPELQNAFFRTFHEFWIDAGFIEANRNNMYFPNLSIGHALGILDGWLALGLACLGLGAIVDSQKADEEDKEELEEELEENVGAA
ncbi:hypothetical protein M3F30_03640 [Corynebacterium sanguinis]|uniref:hypothetical protein n=1 Tax=Corynebacterium sanguinis TaxID=2594913 RepID=UPI00223BB0D4|nr:hypothetical protein [Corynebacterium sanguinis]MCT2287679.1 hypothetical protein [Corynebacterium sanguinis]